MYIFLRCHLLCFSKILCLFRFGNLDIRVDGSGSCRSYHINSKWPFFYLKYLTVENQTISQLFNPIPYWSTTTTILRLFHLSFSFVIFSGMPLLNLPSIPTFCHLLSTRGWSKWHRPGLLSTGKHKNIWPQVRGQSKGHLHSDSNK